MSALSNFPLLRKLLNRSQELPLRLRAATAGDLEAMARLILAGTSSLTAPNDLVEIGRTALSANIPPWIAERDGTPQVAILPAVSPGCTVLLLASAVSDALRAPAMALVNEVCGAAGRQGFRLAQVLLSSDDTRTIELYGLCGFGRLAELIYLQRNVPRHVDRPAVPQGLRWVEYSPQTHGLFAATILASYEGSLDCPQLNGVRQIDDIIAGHRGTGHFDPTHWLTLADERGGLGVLLLNSVPAANALEVVYLALAPAARGKKLGDLLMRQAMAMVSADANASRLTLAVDSTNDPALRLYWRHGMQILGKRLALMRVLP